MSSKGIHSHNSQLPHHWDGSICSQEESLGCCWALLETRDLRQEKDRVDARIAALRTDWSARGIGLTASDSQSNLGSSSRNYRMTEKDMEHPEEGDIRAPQHYRVCSHCQSPDWQKRSEATEVRTDYSYLYFQQTPKRVR